MLVLILNHFIFQSWSWKNPHSNFLYSTSCPINLKLIRRSRALLCIRMPIVLSLVHGKVYALDAIFIHEGASLEEGTLQENSLTCPWHYAVFHVRNGKVSDATVLATDLKSYPVEV